MKVAVIIVNWNGGKLLLESVRSVIEQTYPPYRILIVDNDSSDGSLDTVRQLNCPALEFIEMGSNTGFAAANNFAITLLSDCDWVAMLNPDAIADPEWLVSLVDGVDLYPQAKSFASRMMSLDSPNIVDGAGDCYHISGVMWRRYHGKRLCDVDAMYDSKVFGACGGAAIFERQAFIQAGGFDEDFFCYCEDIDLAFRMQHKGWQCYYLHKAIVYHKGGGTTGSDNYFADYHGHRNLVWTWLKNMPLPLLLMLGPLGLAANILIIIRKVAGGRASPVVKGKWDAIIGLRRQWQKRADIMRNRQSSNLHLLAVMSKSIYRC